MKQVKIGLTGLGRIGQIHLQNLVQRIPGVEVIAVCDISPETEAVAERYGVPHFYASFDSILAHKDIEAVVICSPTDSHFSHIHLAAKAGKHIFCEKPLEMSVAKIQEIESIIANHQVKLQVGFNRRFDPSFARVKERILEGEIGDIHIINITSRDPGLPSLEYLKSSGGLFLDMTIHDFDMARFIAGSEVKGVYAQGLVRIDDSLIAIGDIDTAVVFLKFENGTMATINNSRKSVYGYDQRIEVFGNKGMVNIDNHLNDTHRFYDQWGAHSALNVNFFLERYQEAYLLEMKAFIAALQSNHTMPVGAFDALQATRIAVAASRSMNENRPVEISGH